MFGIERDPVGQRESALILAPGVETSNASTRCGQSRRTGSLTSEGGPQKQDLV